MSNVSSNQDDKPKGFPERGPNVPWGPTAAIVVTVLAFIGAQVLATLVLVAVLGALGTGKTAAETWFTTVAGQFYFVLISDLLILLAVWLFLRGRRAKISQLGFGRRPVWKDVGLALLAYGIYFILLIVVVSLAGALTSINVNQKQELGFENLFGSGEKIMAFISLVLLAPIVEETVFRGFVFTGLRKKMKFVGATIITSLLFAAPHLLASSHGLLWVAGIDTLILSFVLCYLRERTGALWASMGVHALKNGIAFVLLLSSVTTP